MCKTCRLAPVPRPAISHILDVTDVFDVLDALKQAPKGAENLVTMHEELLTKRTVTEQLSRDLEDPGNLIRYIQKTKQECTLQFRSQVLQIDMSMQQTTGMEPGRGLGINSSLYRITEYCLGKNMEIRHYFLNYYLG